MPKLLLLFVGLLVILSVSISTYIVNNPADKLSKTQIESAVNQAKFLYRLRKSEGLDFSNGPCITNALMDDWVLDIAHNPRVKEDDLPGNMCPAYIEGKAKHIVELDKNGDLIRVE